MYRRGHARERRRVRRGTARRARTTTSICGWPALCRRCAGPEPLAEYWHHDGNMSRDSAIDAARGVAGARPARGRRRGAGRPLDDVPRRRRRLEAPLRRGVVVAARDREVARRLRPVAVLRRASAGSAGAGDDDASTRWLAARRATATAEPRRAPSDGRVTHDAHWCRRSSSSYNGEEFLDEAIASVDRRPSRTGN